MNILKFQMSMQLHKEVRRVEKEIWSLLMVVVATIRFVVVGESSKLVLVFFSFLTD